MKKHIKILLSAIATSQCIKAPLVLLDTEHLQLESIKKSNDNKPLSAQSIKLRQSSAINTLKSSQKQPSTNKTQSVKSQPSHKSVETSSTVSSQKTTNPTTNKSQTIHNPGLTQQALDNLQRSYKTSQSRSNAPSFSTISNALTPSITSAQSQKSYTSITSQKPLTSEEIEIKLKQSNLSVLDNTTIESIKNSEFMKTASAEKINHFLSKLDSSISKEQIKTIEKKAKESHVLFDQLFSNTNTQELIHNLELLNQNLPSTIVKDESQKEYKFTNNLTLENLIKKNEREMNNSLKQAFITYNQAQNKDFQSQIELLNAELAKYPERKKKIESKITSLNEEIKLLTARNEKVQKYPKNERLKLKYRLILQKNIIFNHFSSVNFELLNIIRLKSTNEAYKLQQEKNSLHAKIKGLQENYAKRIKGNVTKKEKDEHTRQINKLNQQMKQLTDETNKKLKEADTFTIRQTFKPLTNQIKPSWTERMWIISKIMFMPNYPKN